MRSRSRNKRMCAVAAILNSLRLLLLAVVVLLNFVASQVVCSASVARETKKKTVDSVTFKMFASSFRWLVHEVGCDLWVSDSLFLLSMYSCVCVCARFEGWLSRSQFERNYGNETHIQPNKLWIDCASIHIFTTTTATALLTHNRFGFVTPNTCNIQHTKSKRDRIEFFSVEFLFSVSSSCVIVCTGTEHTDCMRIA